MPFKKLEFRPGYYTEATPTDVANRYVDGDHTRFFKGFPKKIGGSQKYVPTTFLGVCRWLRTWVTLTSDKYIALGTNLKLYVNDQSAFYDITPIRSSGTYANNPFTTSIGTKVITVAQTAHGELVGDYITIAGASAVGGLTINGTYTVTTVINANSFTITSANNASSSVTGGGAAATYSYEIHVGAAHSAVIGFGGGGYGLGTYGTPRTAAGFLEYARTWSGDHYGEDLVCSPRTQPIYIWVAASGLAVRAVIISAAPATNLFVIVSPQNRYIISLGADDGTGNDPMLVRWSSQNDYNDWTPTTINTAGDNRLSEGNLIICGVSTRGQIIISTDTTIYAMYPDSEFVFGFNTLGVGGCISPNGMVENNGIVYWMGQSNFFFYNGTINILECDVRSYVYDNFNSIQAYEVYAWVNTTWNEIWWFYPSSNSNECDRYVCYDYQQRIWHYGSRDMTAGADKGVVSLLPLATGINNYLYSLEAGQDEDGVALNAYYTSGSPQDHNRFSYIRKAVINFKTLVGNMTVQFQTKLYPQDSSAITSAAYPIDSTTQYVCPRIRGDEFNMTFTSDEVGGDFWGGNNEIEVMGTGTR